MSESFTIATSVHFQQRGGRKEMRFGAEPPPPAAPPQERVPRIARLMALAIRLDGLVRSGAVSTMRHWPGWAR